MFPLLIGSEWRREALRTNLWLVPAVEVLAAHVSYSRLVQRAFEKIRQAGRGMPAVLIRQLDALTKIMEHTATEEQRELLVGQANMLVRASEESVPEPTDRADVRKAYDEVLEAAGRSVEAGPAARADASS